LVRIKVEKKLHQHSWLIVVDI